MNAQAVVERMEQPVEPIQNTALTPMDMVGRAVASGASIEVVRLFVKRFDRDDKRIAEMEEQVREFLFELDTTVRRLSERYSLKVAA